MVNKIENNNLIIGVLVVAAIVILLAIFGFGSSGMMNGYGYGMMSGFGPSFGVFGLITWILIIVLVCAAIYWLIKTANKK